jgi:hypothetical protein
MLTLTLPYRRTRNACGVLDIGSVGGGRCHIIISISRMATRFVDASGLDLRNDDAAIAKAKVLAIGVSLDKPEVDPTRHIAVLNASREQIFSVPVYSKPSMSTT